MNIRFAEEADTQAVFGMYESYSGKELEKIGLRYDAEILKRTVAELIKNRSVLVGTNEPGAIIAAVAGAVGQGPFSEDVFFNSLLLYVKPEHRNKTVQFIDSVIELLRENYPMITKIIIANPACSPNGMNRFYKMNGFKEIETHFVRAVKRG